MIKFIKGILDVIGANIGLYSAVLAFGFTVGNYTGWKAHGAWATSTCETEKEALQKLADNNEKLLKGTNDELQKLYADLAKPSPRRVCPKASVPTSRTPVSTARRDEAVGEFRADLYEIRQWVRQNCDRYYGERIILEHFQNAEKQQLDPN